MINDKKEHDGMRPEYRFLDPVIRPWMAQLADQGGFDPSEIVMHAQKNLEGDTLVVYLFRGAQKLGRKDFYVDANGVREVSPDKK
jgi:hypothetical protein